MNPKKLAKLIGTTPAWITRALRQDSKAKGVRARLAATCRSYADAIALGVEFEWEVADQLRQMQRALRSVQEIPTSFGPIHVTRGMGRWIKPIK